VRAAVGDGDLKLRVLAPKRRVRTGGEGDGQVGQVKHLDGRLHVIVLRVGVVFVRGSRGGELHRAGALRRDGDLQTRGRVGRQLGHAPGHPAFRDFGRAGIRVEGFQREGGRERMREHHRCGRLGPLVFEPPEVSGGPVAPDRAGRAFETQGEVGGRAHGDGGFGLVVGQVGVGFRRGDTGAVREVAQARSLPGQGEQFRRAGGQFFQAPNPAAGLRLPVAKVKRGREQLEARRGLAVDHQLAGGFRAAVGDAHQEVEGLAGAGQRGHGAKGQRQIRGGRDGHAGFAKVVPRLEVRFGPGNFQAHGVSAGGGG
jgi:hypothetical protein